MDFIMLQASDNVTRLGVAVLNNFNVYPDKYWYWIGAAAILGFAVLFNVLYTLALMYLNGKNRHSFYVKHFLLLFVVSK